MTSVVSSSSDRVSTLCFRVPQARHQNERSVWTPKSRSPGSDGSFQKSNFVPRHPRTQSIHQFRSTVIANADPIPNTIGSAFFHFADPPWI